MGVFNGFKNGGFSITEDDRFPSGEKDIYGFLLNLAGIFLGQAEISWAIRDSFEKCETFACAKNYLTNTPIISPGYIIIGGLTGNEGTVISRDRFGPAHVDDLSDDRWYLL